MTTTVGVHVKPDDMPTQIKVYWEGVHYTMYLQRGQQQEQRDNPHVVVYSLSRSERERRIKAGRDATMKVIVPCLVLLPP